MKKLFISIMLLLLVSLSFCVYAADETGGYKAEFVKLEDVYTENTVSLFSEPTVPLEEFLYNKILNRTWYNAIDISAYNFSKEEAFARIENMALTNPELMIYTSRYGYLEENGIVTLFAPEYIYNYSWQSLSEWNKMDEWIQDFVDSVDKNLSDEEKLLKTYYFVADNVCYTPKAIVETQNPLIFTAYNAYKNGNCVCQGYVTLMCEILDRLDIECGVVPTVEALKNTAPHIWNYVVLDGKNYHLDITWDDLDYSDAKVGYADFLVSDETRYANMGQREEYASCISSGSSLWEFFDGDKVCDSAKYESGYIWNWYYSIYNITECDRGYSGDCLFALSDGNDTANFIFESIKIPTANIIMSEISDRSHLFFYGKFSKKTNTDIYLVEYDENNRITNVSRPYGIGFDNNFSGMSYVALTKPNVHKINIMWLDSKTFAPLGRNVIME